MADRRVEAGTASSTGGRRWRSAPLRRAVLPCAALGLLLLASPSRSDLQAPDLVPPPTPGNLYVDSKTDRAVVLCWDAVVDTGGSGLKGYKLLRDGHVVSQANSTCQTDDRWPRANTIYTYRVRAYDNWGNESSVSAPVVTQTLPQPPAKPSYDVTVVLVKFSDFPADPFSNAYAEDVVFNGPDSVKSWFDEVTYGATTITGSVHGWYTLPHDGQHYCSLQMDGLWFGCDTDAVKLDVPALLPPLVDLDADDATIYVINGMGAWGFSGISVGATYGFKNFVMIHELLHNFYFAGHAGTWECDGGQLVGPNLVQIIGGGCPVSQYGDPHDPMGAGLTRHPSAQQKIRMGVLDSGDVAVVTTDGIYQIGALEVAGSGIKQLEIPVHDVGAYVVEYRKPVGLDAAPPAVDGVVVRWAPTIPSAGYIATLIPKVATNPVTGTLLVNPGTDFYDSYRDVRISVFQKVGDFVYIEVDVPDAVTISASVPGLLGAAAATLAGVLAATGARRLLGSRRGSGGR